MADPQKPEPLRSDQTIASSPDSESRDLRADATVAGSIVSSDTAAAPRTQKTVPRIPDKFGRYEIEKCLGEGAMGAVYLAHDTQLGRDVALKIPKITAVDGEETMQRFFREARAAAMLRSNNICPVYDVGEVDGQAYITMAFIEGRDLKQLISSGKPISEKQVVSVLRKLALALAEAHKLGIIHRDLKPANIMIDLKGEPVVMDFGLARRTDGEEVQVTQSGSIVGTPAYMSPEQVDGEATLGPPTDIFSLGVIFYELLTLTQPFKGSLITILKQIGTVDPAPPSTLKAGLDPRLDKICLKMLSKPLEKRYASMDEVARDLTDFLRQPGQTSQTNSVAVAAPTSPVPPVAAAKTKAAKARAVPVAPKPEPDAGNETMAWQKLVEEGEPIRRRSRPKKKKPKAWENPVVLVGAGAGVIAVVVLALAISSLFRSKPETTLAVMTTANPGSTTNPTVAWHGWPAGAPTPALAPFAAAQAKKHQEAWARHLDVPVEFINSIGMKFVLIPPGEFTMGSTAEEIAAALKDVDPSYKDWQECVKSEAPQHKVILTQPIYLGVNEVTQAEYEKVMGVNPSYFAPTGEGKAAVAGLETAEHPVDNVSWNDAAEFCTKLSQQEKLKPFYIRDSETFTPQDGPGYRLPSEAEWEFACRAGTATKYWIGDKDEDLMQAGWFRGNSGWRTHAVGELKANPFGLSDIDGNVWEWVQDGWDATYYGQFPDKPGINPNSPFSAGSLRVFRGGAWEGSASGCRSSNRNAGGPSFRHWGLGFRLSLPVDAVKAALVEGIPPVKSSNTSKTGWHGWPADAPPPAIAPFDAAQAKAHQSAWARHLGTTVETTNSVGQKMILIPPGEFLMGSSDADVALAQKIAEETKLDVAGVDRIQEERPQHRVRITQPFRLCAHEVTIGQFAKFVEQAKYKTQAEEFGGNSNTVKPAWVKPENLKLTWRTPGQAVTDDSPVTQVSWNDAVAFCNWLSGQEQLTPCYQRDGDTWTLLPKANGYRLPTEAEWEYSCRAGTTTQYSFGDNWQDHDKYGWSKANAGNGPHAVGSLPANAFGLYDLHGNVWEWCQDWYDGKWYEKSPQDDPLGPSPSRGSYRVIRGGGWSDAAAVCRTASRYPLAPTWRMAHIGFRLALSPSGVAPEAVPGK